MVNYYDFYNFSPSDILDNEWFVFGGIFLIVFAMVFFALSSTFSKTKKDPWGREIKSENKMIVGVIAFIIALFTAAASIQQNWIQNIFQGSSFSMFFFVFLVLGIIIIIPLYKFLKKNTSILSAIIIIFLLFWAFLTFGFNPDNYNLPYQFYDFYEFLIGISYWFIFILVVILIVYLIVKNKDRIPQRPLKMKK